MSLNGHTTFLAGSQFRVSLLFTDVLCQVPGANQVHQVQITAAEERCCQGLDGVLSTRCGTDDNPSESTGGTAAERTLAVPPSRLPQL